MSEVPADGGMRLTAVPISTAAALLRAQGARHLDEAAIRADIVAGAPVNADGTISLFAYGAWLVRELARREARHGG